MSSTATVSYVQGAPVEALPPPVRLTGTIGWLRDNLFSSWLNTAITIALVALIAWIAPPLVKFMFVDAIWDGASRVDCLPRPEHPEIGACWAFVIDRLPFITYGFYPIEERWRVDLFFGLFAVAIVWVAWLNAPRRDLGMVYAFVILPIVSFFLLHGFDAIGLSTVETSSWGGILVTIVVASVGIVVSLPLGILLALGRRSDMPVVRTASVLFIEFVRGVPLITVLFMASLMLPLFVPESWSPDKLVRALVGVALFSSAYMAEVVRAGLLAIPKGQFEAAMAVGLSYWQSMRLIILPQALRVTIPNIVNSYISLFKDTTLVFVVGIFDFLRAIEAARIDPNWATSVTSVSGYAFAAIFYFICCYSMSRYARFVEARLAAGDKR
ncbi:MAG: amino acid ABC transporter permease [Pseudomonadota bacterium]